MGPLPAAGTAPARTRRTPPQRTTQPAARRMLAALAALLVAASTLTVIAAAPAGAHGVTVRRCAYDPFAGNQCWNETSYNHYHTPVQQNLTCGEGMLGTYPNCYPAPSTNENHDPNADKDDDSGGGDDSGGSDGGSDDGGGSGGDGSGGGDDSDGGDDSGGGSGGDVCPAGQTGTPPNCTEPNKNGKGGGTTTSTDSSTTHPDDDGTIDIDDLPEVKLKWIEPGVVEVEVHPVEDGDGGSDGEIEHYECHRANWEPDGHGGCRKIDPNCTGPKCGREGIKLPGWAESLIFCGTAVATTFVLPITGSLLVIACDGYYLYQTVDGLLKKVVDEYSSEGDSSDKKNIDNARDRNDNDGSDSEDGDDGGSGDGTGTGGDGSEAEDEDPEPTPGICDRNSAPTNPYKIGPSNTTPQQWADWWAWFDCPPAQPTT